MSVPISSGVMKQIELALLAICHVFVLKTVHSCAASEAYNLKHKVDMSEVHSLSLQSLLSLEAAIFLPVGLLFQFPL